MNRAARITLLSVATLIAVSVVGVIGWFFYIQIPCEEARKLDAIYQARVAPPEDTNAFFDAFAYIAPEGVDVHARGVERAAWMKRSHQSHDKPEADPGSEHLALKREETTLRLGSACHEDRVKACTEAFLAATGAQKLNAHEDLLLARYEALLGRTTWFEATPAYPNDPLPEFVWVMESQRIRMIRLRQAAQRGEIDGLRDSLERDLRFWRMVLRSADGLLAKMIATAAIRAHFTTANLILRQLPADRIMGSVPPSWEQPLTDEERSMWRAMATEYKYTSNVVRQIYDDGVPFTDAETAQDLPSQVLGKFLRQVGPPRMLNDRARLLFKLARGFDVPLDQYMRAYDAVTLDRPSEQTNNMANYPLRVGSIEGMRRAALLVAQLRSRGVVAADVEAELGRSELRRPFDDKPFKWDAADQAVVHEGPERKRTAIVLYY